MLLRWVLSLLSIALALSFAESLRRGKPLKTQWVKLVFSFALVGASIALGLATP